jgi:hypothetical protein
MVSHSDVPLDLGKLIYLANPEAMTQQDELGDSALLILPSPRKLNSRFDSVQNSCRSRLSTHSFYRH